jgi:hypothetical protein
MRFTFTYESDFPFPTLEDAQEPLETQPIIDVVDLAAFIHKIQGQLDADYLKTKLELFRRQTSLPSLIQGSHITACLSEQSSTYTDWKKLCLQLKPTASQLKAHSEQRITRMLRFKA